MCCSGVGGYLYQPEEETLTKSLTDYSETPQKKKEMQTMSQNRTTDGRRLVGSQTKYVVGNRFIKTRTRLKLY